MHQQVASTMPSESTSAFHGASTVSRRAVGKRTPVPGCPGRFNRKAARGQQYASSIALWATSRVSASESFTTGCTSASMSASPPTNQRPSFSKTASSVTGASTVRVRSRHDDFSAFAECFNQYEIIQYFQYISQSLAVPQQVHLNQQRIFYSTSQVLAASTMSLYQNCCFLLRLHSDTS